MDDPLPRRPPRGGAAAHPRRLGPPQAPLRGVPAQHLGHEPRLPLEERGPRPQRRRAQGGFCHNTGEGGLSPWHLQPGGDLVWQIGTGYFSARTKDGRFDEGMFRERVQAPQVHVVNSARGMMFSLGCIQALRCNSNARPAGVATRHPDLMTGLDVADKTERAYRFHRHTVESLMELLGAAGIGHPAELEPRHIYRRIGDSRVSRYSDLYPRIPDGCLSAGVVPPAFREACERASAGRF